MFCIIFIISFNPYSGRSFGPRMRGKCHCGDSYGQYGVKLPNRTAGLTGAHK